MGRSRKKRGPQTKLEELKDDSPGPEDAASDAASASTGNRPTEMGQVKSPEEKKGGILQTV